MIYKGVKIVPDNHFTKIGQMCVRLEFDSQTCWFDNFVNAIGYIRIISELRNSRRK